MRRRGVRLHLSGIKITTARGKRYYYRRTPAGLVRLPDIADPGFLSAYEASGTGKSRAAGHGTVTALCDALRRSDGWGALKASSRAMQGRILAKIEADRGVAPVGGIRAKHIYADLKGMLPAAANNRLKVWRSLMKLAVRDGWTDADPTRDVQKRKEAGEAHEPWDPEHVEAYRARWAIGTPQRLAFELFYWTGARCVDARRLGRQMVDRKGWLCYAQEKTGGKVAIPLFAPLPGWCASFEPDRKMLLACLEAAEMTFIVTTFGAPRSQKGISQWMARNAREAGLDGLTAHGLRASRAIELYLIDASAQKIGAWTGHLSLREVEHYTRAASRRKLLADG